MYQIRLHGRGGQGVVTAAELIAWAAIADGRHALAFPSFGSERTGAPVEAYCRIGDEPIRAREPVTEPDLVVVLDPTLLRQRFVFDGLKPGGTALINSPLLDDVLSESVLSDRPPADGADSARGPREADPAALGFASRSAQRDAAGLTLCSVHVRAVPATEFARRRTGRALPNAAMLGAIAAATGIVPLAAVRDAIAARFPGPVAEANAAAAVDAFEHIRRGTRESRGQDEPAAPATPEVPGVRF